MSIKTCPVVFTFLAAICLISGCKVEDKLSHKNFKELYSQDVEETELGSRVFNHALDSFTIFLSFKPEQVFQQVDPSIEVYQLNIHATYYENLEASVLIDSFTVKQNLGIIETQKNRIQVSFKGPQIGNAEIMEVKFRDARFAQEFTTLLNLEEPGIDCDQNYLPFKSNGTILTEDFLKINSPYRIIHSEFSGKPIYVTQYTGSFSAALPTFANEDEFSYDFQVDSTFMIEPNQPVTFTNSGVYAFSVDTFKRVGMALVAVKSGYPKISNPVEMMEALRYITSNFEYGGMEEANDPKKIVDEFWLQRAGSFERGKSLIQSYYSRIERANKMFTSFMEGWKTDRGLVSIIHGEPDWVYKNPKSEEWIYLDRKGNKALSFYFLHLNNPLSAKHFYLIRDPEFRESWNNAVHDWRSGKIPE